MEGGEEKPAGGSCSIEEQLPSELRIVLLGAKESGKSSAGNTILGREEFTPGVRTTQSEKRQGAVAGRQVNVVDTPGWPRYFPIDDSPELLKHHVVHSVSLCPPGPHALLLVIDLDSSFQDKHRRTVEEHLELLTERVWRHTIVLFTFGDRLGATAIKQHIEREGQALQWVIEKCGNRYHVLSNRNRSEGSQVTELLEKIEEMVAGNGGCHFHMESEVLQEMEEKRRITDERAKQREEKVQKQRERHRALVKGDNAVFLTGETHHQSERRMVLLGWIAGGKSSSGNTILGREEFGEWRRTTQSERRQSAVAGRQVIVVDTPGWWKFLPTSFTPDWLKQEVIKSFTLCPLGPHAVLLVIPADTSFKEEQRRIIRDNMKYFGERVWRHTIVLFTWGDCLGNNTIEQHIESEGPALQWVIGKCENRYHVLNNLNKEDSTQVTELLEKIEEMEAGNNVFHLNETDSEMVEEIEEKDRDTSGADLSIELLKDPELSQIIDEMWIRREEDLLEKLGLDFLKETDSKRQISGVTPPANFQKMFEREWSRRESATKSRQNRQDSTTLPNRRSSGETPPSRSGDALCESGSSEGAVSSTQEERSFQQEAVSQTQTPEGVEGGEDVFHENTMQQVFEKWIKEGGTTFKEVFEREWNRREREMMDMFRKEIQSSTPLPARREGSLDALPPNVGGDTHSEPDTYDVAQACVKVYDWLREKHPGNSAQVSRHETSPAVSETETSEYNRPTCKRRRSKSLSPSNNF